MIEIGELEQAGDRPAMESQVLEVDFDRSEIAEPDPERINRYDRPYYQVPTGKQLCTVGAHGHSKWSLLRLACGERYVSRSAKLEVTGRLTEFPHEMTRKSLHHAPVAGSIGFDPEVFMHDGTGKLIPAPLFMPNKKQAKQAYGYYRTVSPDTAGDVYADGFAAEMTTKAGTCLGWQADGIRDGLLAIRACARKKYPKADFLARTMVTVEPEEMAKLSDEDTALGCMPSFNAYGLVGNLPPTGRDLLDRVVGGHIHNSTPKPLDVNDAVMITRVVDAILGVASVSLFAGFEHPGRRQYYGLPGEFRLPKHGYEYRVLSNCWLWHPTVMHLVVDLERAAVKLAWAGLGKVVKVDTQEVVETIRYCDVERARVILDRNRELVVGLLKLYYADHYVTNDCASAAFEMLRNGMDSKVKDPMAIGENWRLDNDWMTHTHDSQLTWGQTWQKLGI